jgi:hypothetical protein
MTRPVAALLAYVALTIVATWPLALGLNRDVAWDLGDSLLNMWSIAWNDEQLLAILRGDVSRLGSYFDGNIFHPAPLTLAYTEHMFAPAVQALPVYAATGNPILAYNVLFLASFVLSGWGMYLFVREMTGNAWAGFVAGLLFMFAPYRMPQAPHLQVLSSQWMPLALYGLRRYFDSGRRMPLAGAVAALVTQCLSNGYFLLYFPIFVAAYVLWEIGTRRRWRHRRTWLELTVAAVVLLACVIPFLLPYAAVNAAFAMSRSLSEVIRFSADVYSYATAAGGNAVWGGVVQAFPKAEGDLFPGLAVLTLALIGLAAWPQPDQATLESGRERWPRWVRHLLAALAIVHLVAVAIIIVERRVVIDFRLFELRLSNANQMLLRAAIAGGLLLYASARFRARVRAFLRGPGFFLSCAVMAAWLSLGPSPQVLGRSLELVAPYRLLYDYVPAFEGVRVPARFGMIVALMLAILGGYGASLLMRRRPTQMLLAAIAVLAIAEGLIWPFIINGTSPTPGFNPSTARVYPPSRAPGVYRAVAELPQSAILAEFPLGYSDFDARAMFYSIGHWRQLLNGYAGFYPPHYGRLAVALSDVPQHPQVAWDALREGGATHVIVHEASYLGTSGPETTAALVQLGATQLFRDNADVLLVLP